MFLEVCSMPTSLPVVSFIQRLYFVNLTLNPFKHSTCWCFNVIWISWSKTYFLYREKWILLKSCNHMFLWRHPLVKLRLFQRFSSLVIYIDNLLVIQEIFTSSGVYNCYCMCAEPFLFDLHSNQKYLIDIILHNWTALFQAKQPIAAVILNKVPRGTKLEKKHCGRAKTQSFQHSMRLTFYFLSKNAIFHIRTYLLVCVPECLRECVRSTKIVLL